MEFRANYPIYLQIVEDIKRRIVIGELRPGDKLPSNAELAMVYHVNPNTVQRIFHQLSAEGLAYAKRGIGTYIIEDASLPDTLRQQIGASLTHQFVTQMQTYHFTPEKITALLNEQLELFS